MDIRIINVYGPTEATVYSSWHELERVVVEGQINIPIGRPLPGYQLYVLNGQKGLCPVGVPVERYIGSVGLAREYLNQPDKTAEAFVLNHLPGTPSERLYK